MITPEHKFTNGKIIEVGSLYCIGRNYSEHAKEMGSTTLKDPIVFLKTPQAYFNDSYEFSIPFHSDNVHHELEMLAVIGKDGMNIDESIAMSFIAGIGVGVDFTARDVQSKAKENGHPWTFAKSFYRSAPVSQIIPAEKIESEYFDIQLKKNGEIQQSANTSEMEHSLSHLISYLSKYFHLKVGDCIFTGTPSGVSKVTTGDILNVDLNGQVGFELRIV